MSNLFQFTNKQNVSLLWDILLDELHINTNDKSLTLNVRTVFDSNIKPFTTTSNPKTPLMELNKQFLSQVVLAINRLFPNLQKQYQNIKRITITNEEASEPYKIEDIHSSRQTDFENLRDNHKLLKKLLTKNNILNKSHNHYLARNKLNRNKLKELQ